ncbi:alkaline phosphatase [Desulfosarcina cetonica]|uniref:alkaline phosphatase n=1 Tax=Desulfosarcina cetonica TaxID=90730 RepID=UPI0006D25F44|nr:alkaline phosphatase [Desulfosarcina cetonica]
MITAKKVLIVGFSVVFGCSLMTSSAIAKNCKKHGHHKKAKNIIFMVPDGQGLSNVTAARIFKNGPDGMPLNQETLKNIGYQRTHSADSTVTDSAAAASAWAVGQKFLNGEISCHGDSETGKCSDPVPTILELAEKMGMATGLVASSQISHATPAHSVPTRFHEIAAWRLPANILLTPALM